MDKCHNKIVDIIMTLALVKRGNVMLARDTDIYLFIKDKLDEIPVLKVKKGDYLCRAHNRESQIYYVLKGEVKIYCTSIMGKKILVDELTENEFAGHLSNRRQSNFHCDSLAYTDLELLCINDDIMDILMQNSEFASMFYGKTSKRLYLMYKKSLTNELFSQRELLAYYIIKNSNNGKLVYKSIDHICEVLSISRRNLYNILNDFMHKGVIEKEGISAIVIKDEKYLKDMIVEIEGFLENA
jgi:CRP-like cAMP-binding protein